MKKYLLSLKHIAILLMLSGGLLTCTMKDIVENENEMIEHENVGSKSLTTSSYFYYYQGEKLYFELDTRYVFVSVANEQAAQSFSSRNANSMRNSFSVDIPEGMRSKTQHKRHWAVLNVDDVLSEEAYLEKLADIKHTEKNIITAPYFKGPDFDGL